MITDFGLSRIMDTENLTMFTEISGTPGVGVFALDLLFIYLNAMIVYGSRDLQKEYVFLPFVVDCRSN